MSWLENIRNKPRDYKMRLIWIIVAVVAIILIIIAVLSSKIGENFNIASLFFKQTVNQFKSTGQELYQQNK